ncbi:MAG: hypothetical protein AAF727_04505 [Pseudomonadota bacterium]
MFPSRAALFVAALTLAACDEQFAGGGFTQLPENIVEIAGPNQDLSTARLREEDNCYWYQHAGPVETTPLPLRNREGRPICVQPAA